ncbi:hypothetical protein SMG44B_20443 [Stenotrophomonas maltophilia]|nr:hypothetical protein BN126310030 [Stenotrophomonas maltophilia]
MHRFRTANDQHHEQRERSADSSLSRNNDADVVAVIIPAMHAKWMDRRRITPGGDSPCSIERPRVWPTRCRRPLC